MASFDSSDKESWFFGMVSRKDAEERLLGQEPGLFLVRESTSCQGDYVLSVSENNKVSHYIIEVKQENYHIGELHFQSLPAVIEFYKVHYLDTTTLSRPCPMTAPPPPPVNVPEPEKPISMKYILKFKFQGEDEEDLPAKKGEVLVLVQKEEDNWWRMRNDKGETGLVPRNYMEKLEKEKVPRDPRGETNEYRAITQEPVLAKAVQQRIPTPYDYTQLRLDVGDLVKVINRNTSGQWEGEVVGNGRTGHFPFKCVRVLGGTERDEAIQQMSTNRISTNSEDDVTKKMNGMKM